MARRGGNEEMGYTIAFDPATRALTVQAWGFWSATIATDFVEAVVEEQQRAGLVRVVAFDMGDLKPMREEGQIGWRRLIAKLATTSAIQVISISTRSQLTKLQLLRLARESAPEHLTKLQWMDGALASSGGTTR